MRTPWSFWPFVRQCCLNRYYKRYLASRDSKIVPVNFGDGMFCDFAVAMGFCTQAVGEGEYDKESGLYRIKSDLDENVKIIILCK